MYLMNCNPESIKPVIAGAAISGLFVIFQADEFFRIKKGDFMVHKVSKFLNPILR
jgi:hypothetical protein